jgi:hypothetical protein
MTNVYPLAKTWRYLSIIPAVLLFLLFWSAFFFGGGLLDMPFGAWMLLIVVSGVAIGMIYFTLTSKIVTSPEGIEYTSFGIHMRATWNQVEKIEFTPDGFVNLYFKEPIYPNSLVNALYGKTILISPYTGNLATSNLLKDLANYVPNSNIPEFVAQQKYSVKTYQDAGVIGLYYLGWFIVGSLFGIAFQKGAESYLTTLGLQNVDQFSGFVGFSLLFGLFFNALRLLRQYNAEIIKLDENGIAHRARAHYLSPLLILVTSSLIGIAFLPRLLDVKLDAVVMVLISAVSLPVSSLVERLLFPDKLGKLKSA